MNLQNDSTKLEKNLQEVIEKWNKKILPHLPENLDELANKTGVIQRKRGVNSATDLLKILFLYACSKVSFRILAFAACVLGISTIYDTAWRKQFSKSIPFLNEILHSMLSSFIPFKVDETSLKGVKNVLLADGSVVRQNGKQQAQQRIHMCYSLNQNRMQQVKALDCPSAGYVRSCRILNLSRGVHRNSPFSGWQGDTGTFPGVLLFLRRRGACVSPVYRRELHLHLW